MDTFITLTGDELIASLEKFEQDAAKLIYEGYKIGKQYHAEITTSQMFGEMVKSTLANNIGATIHEIDASIDVKKKHAILIRTKNMPDGIQILSFSIVMNEKERKYLKTRTDYPVQSFCKGCEEFKPINDCLWCAGCKSIQYCSRECQKAHWKTHKPDCVKKA